jgi:hypothetical protein
MAIPRTVYFLGLPAGLPTGRVGNPANDVGRTPVSPGFPFTTGVTSVQRGDEGREIAGAGLRRRIAGRAVTGRRANSGYAWSPEARMPAPIGVQRVADSPSRAPIPLPVTPQKTDKITEGGHVKFHRLAASQILPQEMSRVYHPAGMIFKVGCKKGESRCNVMPKLPVFPQCQRRCSYLHCVCQRFESLSAHCKSNRFPKKSFRELF